MRDQKSKHLHCCFCNSVCSLCESPHFLAASVRLRCHLQYYQNEKASFTGVVHWTKANSNPILHETTLIASSEWERCENRVTFQLFCFYVICRPTFMLVCWSRSASFMYERISITMPLTFHYPMKFKIELIFQLIEVLTALTEHVNVQLYDGLLKTLRLIVVLKWQVKL